MNKIEIINKLNEYIANCEKHANIFEQKRMESSAHCSLAMKTAYQIAIDLIESELCKKCNGLGQFKNTFGEYVACNECGCKEREGI